MPRPGPGALRPPRTSHRLPETRGTGLQAHTPGALSPRPLKASAHPRPRHPGCRPRLPAHASEWAGSPSAGLSRRGGPGPAFSARTKPVITRSLDCGAQAAGRLDSVWTDVLPLLSGDPGHQHEERPILSKVTTTWVCLCPSKPPHQHGAIPWGKANTAGSVPPGRPHARFLSGGW